MVLAEDAISSDAQSASKIRGRGGGVFLLTPMYISTNNKHYISWPIAA